MKITFTKMSGAGNDFVVVDNRKKIISDPHSFAVKVCDRRLGIGADGLLLLETSTNADFMMKYYNADGTDAGMCGNGGRCIAKYAFDLGVVSKERFNFEALGYIYEARRISATVFDLKMKNPFDLKRDQHIVVSGRTINGNYLNTGTDHCMLFLDENPGLGSLESADVFGIGRTIRNHALFQPKGTNVNFISRTATNSIEIRTYERGVEEETLACGTGSVASALLSALKYAMQSPVNVKVRSGEVLEISFQKKENMFTDVHLKGNAVVTFTGEIDA